MKSEPNPSTNGSSFNFGNFTPHDTGDMQFGGDISNQHAATAMNGTESYLLGLEESEYLLAPFDSSADIFAFRGSPSPPESQEQSPKSTNTSARSSESSPPQVPTTQAGKMGSSGPDALSMMADPEDDFPMLDDGSITFPLSSTSNGFFGSNFTPLVPAPSHLPSNFVAPGIGNDKMSVDDPAKFFDFESAASSPLALKVESTNQRQASIPRFFGSPKAQMRAANGGSRKKRRSESATLSPTSTDAALAAFTFDTSSHPSPSNSASSAVIHNRNGKRQSSASAVGDDDMLKSTGFHSTKPFSMNNMWSPSTSFASASPMNNVLAYTPSGISVGVNGVNETRLTLRGDQPFGRINEKSRVETQIRINLNLSPLPAGVTKLHLPQHTISKPKLLSKPPHQKAEGTYELYTSLVCASAIESGGEESLQRVLKRAADDPLQERIFGPKGSNTSPGEDGKDVIVVGDEEKPLNGGEVRICTGCITRERKRAARKKIKKVEEEESWARDEGRRIIVFNCPEVLDWGPPEAQRREMEASGIDGIESSLEGNGEIWLPMRIACYCRHQSEKTGFRIILTIKDHNDNLVAQNITPPILITDDHKTNAPSHAAASQPVPTQPAPVSNVGSPSSQGVAAIAPAPVASAPPTLAYSASDTNLLSMNQAQMNPFDRSQARGHVRGHSRQGSVSGVIRSPPAYTAGAEPGPSAKKRKANATAKARNELTMTKIDTASQAGVSQAAPFTPSTQNFGVNGFDQSFAPTTPMETTTAQQQPPPSYFGFHNRNHSIDSLAGMQIFSAPPSAQASRAPSRVASPVQQFATLATQRQIPPVQFSQAQAALMDHLAAQSAAASAQGILPFDITRIVPAEGPCQGGIEVTILGSNFHRSHTVFFGEKQSPRTEYWSDSTIVCLLPPSSTPGPVSVYLRYAAQHNVPIMGRQGRFMYTDDTEQKMLALALQVINAKWSGKIEPPKDIAMRLLMDERSPGASSGPGGSGGSSGGSGTTRNFNAQAMQLLQNPAVSIDLEGQLLKLLDIIDMDDSPFPAKLNLRNRSGQTMLHLSCSLGYSRFTAGLLARGANPDVPDKGGYTPCHFASLNGHADLVRRLRLNRADLGARSLSGVTPEDLADGDEGVYGELMLGLGFAGRRSRRQSISSINSAPASRMGRRSRRNSVAIKEWEAEYDDDSSEDDETEEEEDDLWIRPQRTFSGRNLRDLASGKLTMIPRATTASDKPMSRNASMTNLAALAAAGADVSNIGPVAAELAVTDDNGDPAAPAMAAMIREQLTNMFNANLNLPNWNFNFQQGLHAQQMLRNELARFNAFVQGQRAANPAVPEADHDVPDTLDDSDVKTVTGREREGNYKWWELFSNPAAPPAYEELYPHGGKPSGDEKVRLVGEAVTRALDTKVAIATGANVQQPPITVRRVAIASSSVKTKTVTVAAPKAPKLSIEEEEALRRHHRKMQRIRGDRRLIFFWLPILLIILCTLLTSWGTKTWLVVRTTYEVVRERMAEAAEATAGVVAQRRGAVIGEV